VNGREPKRVKVVARGAKMEMKRDKGVNDVSRPEHTWYVEIAPHWRLPLFNLLWVKAPDIS